MTAAINRDAIRGHRAEGFYEEFVIPFLAEKRKTLFETFQNIPINEIEQLQEVRRMLTVLTAFENDITDTILSGKFARGE